MARCKENMESYVRLVQEERVVVETKKVLDLVNGKCQVTKCTGEQKVVHSTSEGGVLSVSYKCSNGHAGVWHSSSLLTPKRGQKVFAISLLLSSSILLTGNNFEKILFFAQALNLSFVSSATFNRIQSLYAIPAIKAFWEEMKKVWLFLKNEALILSGDARMDSPGFSAKYCTYIIMDHYLDIIIDLEIVDKRETGGASTVMEKVGLKRLMQRMMKDLHINELVTDASNVIIKLLRDMKDQFPENLQEFFHSLDIWHKSCKITAKISVAAKTRGCEVLSQWIQPVRNHFWHCAENCEGGEQNLNVDFKTPLETTDTYYFNNSCHMHIA